MKLEINKAYAVSNSYKKSIVEAETFEKEDGDLRKFVVLNIVWRGGTYIVRPQNQDEIDILEENLVDIDSDDPIKENASICITDFEDWELDSTHDGVDEWLEFINVEDDEEQVVREGYAEDMTSWLEENDWYPSDLEVYIENGIVIEDAPDLYNES